MVEICRKLIVKKLKQNLHFDFETLVLINIIFAPEQYIWEIWDLQTYMYFLLEI